MERGKRIIRPKFADVQWGFRNDLSATYRWNVAQKMICLVGDVAGINSFPYRECVGIERANKKQQWTVTTVTPSLRANILSSKVAWVPFASIAYTIFTCPTYTITCPINDIKSEASLIKSTTSLPSFSHSSVSRYVLSMMFSYPSIFTQLRCLVSILEPVQQSPL